MYIIVAGCTNPCRGDGLFAAAAGQGSPGPQPSPDLQGGDSNSSNSEHRDLHGQMLVIEPEATSKLGFDEGVA